MRQEWVSVEDALPEASELRKYEVKCICGSAKPFEVIKIVLGCKYPNEFRFFVGDWQVVTHWRDL